MRTVQGNPEIDVVVVDNSADILLFEGGPGGEYRIRRQSWIAKWPGLVNAQYRRIGHGDCLAAEHVVGLTEIGGAGAVFNPPFNR